MTKVVAFGAFVEILEGVEGLVHISELAQQHVENPREIVAAGRRGQGQDPRDRLRAPPALALDQAGRGPGPAAPHRGPDRRRRRPRGHAGARPVRGRLRRGARPWSRTTRREVARPAEAAVEDAPVDEAPGRRGRPPSRRPAVEDAAGRGRARPAPEPRTRLPPSEPPPKRRASRRRSDRAAVRRPDGRHRRREVGGARRAGAPRARRRSPPTRSSTSSTRIPRCAPPWWRAGATRSRPTGGWTARRSPATRSPPTRSATGSRACCGRAWARGSPQWREDAVAARPGAARRWWSRRRCCSRRAWRATTTRRSRSWPTRRSGPSARGARGHEALDERTARQLTQAEKAARATYAVENSGSLRELEQELSGVLAKLTV